MINFYAENIDKPILDYQLVKKWIKNVIENYNKKLGDISVIFCSDEFLLDYNIRYLQHNYYTDIITFNYNHVNKISGDLFLSIDTITRNSLEYNVPLSIEYLRVIIHGVLHLIGFNDSNENEIFEMREQEAIALSLFEFYKDNSK